jgi:tellurite resistance protein TerC
MATTAGLIDWVVFAAGIFGTMVLDRFLSRGSRDAIPFRLALIRSLLWIFAGLSVAFWILARFDSASAITYVTAYLVEESLSVDNLFVFLVIFRHFGVKDAEQNRVLFWGVLGAIVLRGVFIVAGAELLHHFSSTAYVFGAILVISGLKLLKKDKGYTNPEDTLVFRTARKVLRTTPDYVGDRFFIRQEGSWVATPLLLVLIAIEFTDILFAVDSVPAVLAISQDMYIVYTSNILAVLGLRALFFLLSGMMDRFHKLDVALSLILVFVGLKMGLHHFVQIPNLVSLAVVVALLASGIVWSLIAQPGQNNHGVNRS